MLDTFQIQDITDDGTYLSDLGRPEQARVGQLAAVAEAEAMDKRAAAFAAYNDAAGLQMLIGVLPRLAKEVAAPMASIDKLTVVSTDGAGEVPRQVTNNVVQTLEMLKNTTGVDLQQLVQRYTGEGTDSTRQDRLLQG